MCGTPSRIRGWVASTGDRPWPAVRVGLWNMSDARTLHRQPVLSRPRTCGRRAAVRGLVDEPRPDPRTLVRSPSAWRVGAAVESQDDSTMLELRGNAR